MDMRVRKTRRAAKARLAYQAGFGNTFSSEALKGALPLGRNHYDRVGHFAQGFVPAILAREVLIRRSVVRGRGWLFFVVTSVCLAVSALSALLLAVLPGVAGTAIALAVYGAGFSLAFAAAVPWLDEAFEETERGLAYGVQNLLYAGGYAIGPIIGGVLLELGGANLAYILTAVALAACTIALATAPPTRGRRRAPSRARHTPSTGSRAGATEFRSCG